VIEDRDWRDALVPTQETGLGALDWWRDMILEVYGRQRILLGLVC